MSRLFKKVSDGPILAIILISLTAIITHGLSIPRLGYYHDDWYTLWSGVSRGAGSLVSLFSTDRPFMGYVYSKVYRVLQENMLGWHLVTLLFRIVGGVAFYWILNLAWPRLKSYFIPAAMLFVVFPGFLAEPNAATKINHLLGYGAALFSIAFTLQAAKTSQRKWKYTWIGLSILSMAFYLWIYEYMIGLEVMRIALLYWVQWQGEREKVLAAAKKVLLAYIPHLLVIGLFLYWRMFIFDSMRKGTDFWGLVSDYQSNTSSMSFRLVSQGIKDFFSASVFAWFVEPYHLLASANFGGIAAAFVTALVVMGIATAYLYALRKPESAEGESESGAPIVLVITGALIVLGAVLPVVISKRALDLMDPYKAYALHPSAGALILVIGLVAMMKPKFRMPVFIVLLGLSVATQTLNIQNWATLWDTHRNFWWQVSWRVPNIRDNTLVMAVSPDGYGFQQDYEVWGPLNLIYRPEREIAPLIQSEVLNSDTLMNVIQGSQPVIYERDIYFPRNYKNFLLISQPTMNSCVHVIDSKMPAYSASERLIVEQAGSFSSLDFIDPAAKPATPPRAIFGKEPAHGWCYYYQQASLARQVGDWKKIGELYDAAQSAGLEPGDPSEYFVFIEGLVNLGRADEAKEIASSEIEGSAALKYSLCKNLASAPVYPDSFGYHLDEINKVVCK